MNPLLLFTPPAQPSYMPFGISVLSQYANERGTTLPALDLNMTSWNLEVGKDTAAKRWKSFTRNEEGNFYNPESYLDNLRWRGEAFSWQQKLESQCRTFLNTGNLPPLLEEHFLEHVRSIQTFQADTLLFSAMFLPQLLYILAFTRFLKMYKYGFTVYCGGAALSALDLNQFSGIDFIDGFLQGEGEEAVLSLLTGTSIEPTHPVPGMADFSYFNLDDYFTPEPVLPAAFSRDCKWRRCRFCAHNFSFAGYRAKEISAFSDELEHYKSKYNCSSFYLTDQYINGSDAVKIGNELSLRNSSISYHFMGRPYEKDFNADSFDTLSRGGCAWISWGVESGSDRLLDICGKGTNTPGIEWILENSHNAGIINMLMMIFGLPETSHDDFNRTINFLNRVSPFTTSMTESNFVLFENTPFGKQGSRYNLRMEEPETLCMISGKPVFTYRRNFSQLYENQWHPSAGGDELARWDKIKTWVMPPSVYSYLPAEHYLLYAIHARSRSHGKGLPGGRAA